MLSFFQMVKSYQSMTQSHTDLNARKASNRAQVRYKSLLTSLILQFPSQINFLYILVPWALASVAFLGEKT